jgi:hypothetical protein
MILEKNVSHKFENMIEKEVKMLLAAVGFEPTPRKTGA